MPRQWAIFGQKVPLIGGGSHAGPSQCRCCVQLGSGFGQFVEGGAPKYHSYACDWSLLLLSYSAPVSLLLESRNCSSGTLPTRENATEDPTLQMLQAPVTQPGPLYLSEPVPVTRLAAGGYPLGAATKKVPAERRNSSWHLPLAGKRSQPSRLAEFDPRKANDSGFIACLYIVGSTGPD
jgi:hypothetical protein